MKLTPTHIEGLCIFEPQVFGDSRGYFMESYKEEWFKQHFPDVNLIQDNESMSTKGVLRGLHFQKPPFAQAKLVRAIQGEILDITVDLRKTSPTYGEVYSIVLNATNKKQLFIPRGFAHGFVVLSEEAIFSYKVDNVYSTKHEDGIIWNDSTLNIDWQINKSQIILSDKDSTLSTFKDFQTPFE
jgi:dTDP-4-dehydrorhamnose 3,5-epimerase